MQAYSDQLGGMLGQGGGSDAIGAIGNLIGKSSTEGLDRLVQQLQNEPERHRPSWVGTGANLPVSADRCSGRLRPDQPDRRQPSTDQARQSGATVARK